MTTPKVSLIDYTGRGRPDQEWHAAHILVFTKSTRLSMDSGLLDTIVGMPKSDLAAELEYMASTIPSSWEFVDLTFLIENVSRACAQQITRTRTGSYAMQSQRVVDVRSAPIHNPLPVGSKAHRDFGRRARDCVVRYQHSLDEGMSKQDARGLLPMNICCNLVAKYNLRSFVDLIRARRSLRTQGEYAEIVRQMEALVLAAWPWSAPFFEPPAAKAITMLEEAAQEVGVETGTGPGWKIAKAIDLLRKG